MKKKFYRFVGNTKEEKQKNFLKFIRTRFKQFKSYNKLIEYANNFSWCNYYAEGFEFDTPETTDDSSMWGHGCCGRYKDSRHELFQQSNIGEL